MKVLAIDPGPTKSAVCCMQEDGMSFHTLDNSAMLRFIASQPADHAVIEMVQSYGMAVGKDIFETVFWIGRFYHELCRRCPRVERLGRREVKLHLCGLARAKDSNIRQALIDRFGGTEGKAKAIGKKASPGPLYRVKGDEWAALALAMTYIDTVEAHA